MEIEFDKEIDAILRSAAKGSSSVNLQPEHLDADEISLFAENVLPANARVRALEHLADCNRCRKVLVEISGFAEDEIPSEIVHIIETKNEIAWYKKLFAFPNLAYSLGGLFVLFAGIIGFVAFQSRNAVNSDVASVAEKPAYSKGASSDGIEQNKEVLSQNSNATAAANTVANTTIPTETAKQVTVNTAIAANNVPNLPQTSTATPVVIQPTPLKETAKDNKPKVVSEVGRATPTDELALPKPVESQPNPAAGATVNRERTADKSPENRKIESEAKSKTDVSTADSYSTKDTDDAKLVTRSAPMITSPAPMPAKPSKKMPAQDNAENSKQVGGKTFRKIGGTWFDSSYGKQSQTTVKRGSDDYKKLDGGLQNIGNSLGGTVIVVWNGKAYKIQ